MPRFEYTCKTCGPNFEALVSSADAGVACENCGSKQANKLLSTLSTSVA